MTNRSASVLLFASALAAAASAQVPKPGDPGLSGVASANTWNDLNASNYNAFPVASLQGASGVAGGASLVRVSGSSSFSSGSIYGGFGGADSAYRLDVAPLAGVGTVVFQIRIGTGIGTLTTAPTLNYTTSTGATGSLSTTQQLLASGSDSVGGQGITMNLFKYQWDLNGLGTVTGLNVAYGAGLHTTTTNLRIDQAQAVPEPASMAALAMGAAALRRRKRKA